MLFRVLLAFLTISACGFLAFAQAPAAEEKAYRVAARLTDPQQKIAALENVLVGEREATALLPP